MDTNAQLQPDWHAETNPDVLIGIIRAPYGQQQDPNHITRRMMLYSCASARMVWGFLPTDARNCVKVRERLADKRATLTDMRAAAIKSPNGAITYRQHALAAAAGHPNAVANAVACHAAGTSPADYFRRAKWHSVWMAAFNEARAYQAELVRDIFPPPGYTPNLNPDWLTSTVVAIAKQMDATGDFSAVPILADALQDAGCDDSVMLDRCRAPSQVHCRGNWVVDLILGRE